MEIRLFLCGDVMTGRGVDQILRRPVDPAIHEPYMNDARDYVRLAEQAGGPVPRGVEPGYIWGDALAELERFAPHARIANLETAVTTSGDWEAKGINYRMSPRNVDCLTAARIDCCALANNHVLDWGAQGLRETLDTLHAAGLRTCGAGRDAQEAEAPAIVPLAPETRLLLFSFAHASSGVPRAWAARQGVPGVAWLEDLSQASVERIAAQIAQARSPGDLVVASVHWGPNWGYAVSAAEQRFAHALVERAGVDVFHGHSSHHPKPLEVFRGKPILYGCGDLINDYEGIPGHEEYAAGLGLMYLLTLEDGALQALTMSPMRLRKFRLARAPRDEEAWLRETLERESRQFGTRLHLDAGGRIRVQAAG